MEKLPLTADQYLLALDVRLTALEAAAAPPPPATQAPNTVLAGPATGVPALPTFRALVAADIPVLGAQTPAMPMR